MKNALILHGTDFDKAQTQHLTNWFPWLKDELERLGYSVWLPELPEAWYPNLERYWNFVKEFGFNEETLIIGHSSGAAALFAILNMLPADKKVKLAVSVAGFYKDEGWNCEGLFTEPWNWEKIREQARKIILIASEDDPYVSLEHVRYFEKQLRITPQIYSDKKHFNLEVGEQFRRFPELLQIIKREV